MNIQLLPNHITTQIELNDVQIHIILAGCTMLENYNIQHPHGKEFAKLKSIVLDKIEELNNVNNQLHYSQ